MLLKIFPRSVSVVSLSCLMLIGSGWSLSAVSAADNTAALEQRLADAVRYLASDELEGRGIGTKGLNQAAEFIARQFQEAGLRTAIVEETPFQKFTMTTRVELGSEQENSLVLVGPGMNGADAPRLELKLQKDFNPLAIGGSGKFSAPLVFAGYGITAKDLGYDDYKGLDVEGKVVVLIRKEPQQKDPHSAFDGSNASRHATFMSKIANANEHGAVAVILVNDAIGLGESAQAAQKAFDEAVAKLAESHQEFAQLDKPNDDQRAKYRSDVMALAERIQTAGKQLAAGDHDQVLGFREAGGESNHRSLPVYFCRRSVMDGVIRQALGKDLAALEQEIDKGPTPRSQVLEGWRAEGQAALQFEESEVKNVLGVLDGEGPLADETIIVGAHYDHLGMGGTGNSLAPGTIAVHNGADDNASGTSALIEVARQIAQRDKAPRRRIVFMAFTGEESGLFGSAHYVKRPVFPLENTVAMVNMDMVGRLQDNKLIVHGTGTATEFDGLIDSLNQVHAFKLTKEPSGYGPSDHQTFYERKIPVLHVFTGTHSDYHRPSDDFERINVEGMRRIVGLVSEVVAAIDSADARPTYQATKRPVMDRGGNRPYLGTIPDFSEQVDGYALMGVAPDSPAAKGGLKAGDVITRFGESKISGLADIDSALRKFKAGDTVKVTVKRGEATVELDIVLAPPR